MNIEELYKDVDKELQEHGLSVEQREVFLISIRMAYHMGSRDELKVELKNLKRK